MPDAKELQKIASQVRRDIVRMTHGAASGHPGGSLGCTDFMTALYFEIMDHNPEFTMDGVNEDIFFLSNGHISPVFYSVLARSGYFDVSELATFRMINSRVQGHPATAEGLPGIRMASGSLGQGMSVAVGAAVTKRLNGDDHLVYSLHSDGELQEGQSWEGIMFAAHHKIDNLIATVDYNKIQIDGSSDDVMSLGDLGAKWRAFGWEVLEMDGHNMSAILETMAQAKSMTGNGTPIVVLMTTTIGKGVDYMEGESKWHGVAPNDEELELALSQQEETLQDY
jgi:transketolase